MKRRKQKELRNLIRGITEEYREAGAETDPLGMYTGVPRGTPTAVQEVSSLSAAPGSRTPAAPVPNGKRYLPAGAVPPEDVWQPVQDADDL